MAKKLQTICKSTRKRQKGSQSLDKRNKRTETEVTKVCCKIQQKKVAVKNVIQEKGPLSGDIYKHIYKHHANMDGERGVSLQTLG